MKNEECGQVTIFLSLLLISFLLILSVCLEGIYLHIQKGRIAQQQAAAGEYAQANYHKELLEQYHIFAIDGRYGAKMEASLKRNWTYHTGNAPSVLHISNAVAVTGSDGQVLRHQIREYMKYAESAKLLDQIKDSLSGVKEEAETDSIKNQVEHIKEEDSDQEVQVEEQPVQDPRKGLKKLLSEGDMRSREIYMRMSDEGISRRTAENTKKELGIRSYRKMRQWYWSIKPEE